jgi:putative glutathione S-transferase
MKGIGRIGCDDRGVYTAEDPGPDTVEAGTFLRAKATIRNWITRDGSSAFRRRRGAITSMRRGTAPGRTGRLLALVEKGLSGAISVSYARPRRTPEGWVFDAEGLIRTG